MDRHDKMRNASYLLPDPGGEVVRELLDEIASLQSDIQLMAAPRDSVGSVVLAYRAEIAALKAVVSNYGTPLPPHILADARQETVHEKSGKARPGKTAQRRGGVT
jgi:hypothetical protein